MRKLLPILAGIFAVTFLLTAKIHAQEVKPPYVLSRNNERIKSKNFLAGRKPLYGKIYQIYNHPKTASITFNKETNEFEIVTGAENTSQSIQLAERNLGKAETALLFATGIAAADKCNLNVTMRIIVPNTTDGGLSYDRFHSCRNNGSNQTIESSKSPEKTRQTNNVSEQDLRERMMSDGLRDALEGCEGVPVSIEQTKIDLNRDGQTEIIATASSGCWGAQGTKTWIYGRAKA